MPELPEVETTVRGLKRKVINKTITDLWTDWPKYFRKTHKSTQSFKRHTVGKKITNISRRGKNILLHLSDTHIKSESLRNSDLERGVGGTGCSPVSESSEPQASAGNQGFLEHSAEHSEAYVLLIHQKLSGHLMVGKWINNKNKKFKENLKKLSEKWKNQKWIPENPHDKLLIDPKNRFIRLTFFLNNPNNNQYLDVRRPDMLAFSDLRRFGKIMCGPKSEILNSPDLGNLGPEVIDPKLTPKKFVELAKSKNWPIKQTLLDQNIVAGIGNIYADETLWSAKTHPLTRTKSLTDKDLKKIFTSARRILQKAIKLGGTSIDDFRDITGTKGTYSNYLMAYQREGKPCPRCKTPIKRIKIGPRSAHFCPKCQKA